MHYGTYTNELYQSKITPALILNPGEGDFAVSQGLPVRTVSANVSPYAGGKLSEKTGIAYSCACGAVRHLAGVNGVPDDCAGAGGTFF